MTTKLIAEKSSVARDFGAASASYDDAARLQRHMGGQLLHRLNGASDASCVVDLGCGTGQFSGALQAMFSQAQLTGIDLSEPMVRFAGESRSRDWRWLVADAEQLPLAGNSTDVIFSNLMIQWCADPRPVLRECLRALRPGGTLVCSTLLDGTLHELVQAWSVVDPGVEHVNRFETAEALTVQVRDVCPDAQIEHEAVRLPYRSPLVLLGELKALGAQYKGKRGRKTLTAPGRVRRLCQAYPQESGQAFATYQAAYVICRKPSA